ncbi:MAG: putative metal-dependent enzyme [Thermoleophilia bacterium]|nr:putative metal-dependent enzyme [Thermoleophilia bacterium]
MISVRLVRPRMRGVACLDMTDSPARRAPVTDSAPRVLRRSRRARLGWILARTPHVLLQAPAAAVGGQAVMDGVMMRGPHSWAVAIRLHDGTIAVKHRELVSFAAKRRWARLPLIRGVVALFESLIIGMRALFVSSEYAIENVEAKFAEEEAANAAASPTAVAPTERSDEEEKELHRVERAASLASATTAGAGPVPLPHNEDRPEPDPDKLGTGAIILAMAFAIGFSVVLFKIVPVTLVTFIPGIDKGSWWFVIVEAGIKFALFCAYLLAVGQMADMKRVFEYHSAEHKAINALEHGIPLEPERVNEMSRIHVRCGTAFIVWLFIVGLLVFRVAQLTFLQDAPRWEIIASRPLLLPIIAGLSFEILRFAGRHADNGALRAILAPGLWFQRLTTRECTPEQCEVAIKSLQVVVDFEAERTAQAKAAGHDLDATAGDDAYRVLA